MLYVHASNRTSKATITIRSAEGEKVVTQNQREACLEDGIPRSLGVFAFAKGKSGTIEISNAGADGFVVVDGLQLVQRPKPSRHNVADSGLPHEDERGRDAGENSAADAFEKRSNPQDVDGHMTSSSSVARRAASPAVRAAREGLSVLLVNHTQHLGGFVTSGAGGWEAPYDGLRSPIYGEMIAGAAQYYAKTYGEESPQRACLNASKTSRAHIDRPKIEPRIAEMLFNQIVEEGRR